MKIARALFIVLCVTIPATVMVASFDFKSSFAQSPTPPGLADPVALKVSRADLMVIGQGLQELPAKLANPVLNMLQAQLAEADKAAAEAAAKKAAEPKPEEKPAKDTPKKP